MAKETGKDLKIWILLYQARDAMVRAREKELRGTGLTLAQLALLYIVKELEPKPTLTNIGRWMFRETHTVFALVETMEKRGLVKKVKDLERKNLVRVVITKKGEEAYQSALQKRTGVGEIMSVFSEEEKDEFIDYLTRVRDKSLEKLHLKSLSYPE